MNISRLKSAGFKSRHLILGIVVWWMLIALGYAITVLRIEHVNAAIRESGIHIVNELAKQISVNLLEKDTQAIRRQLMDINKNDGIIYLAVSDYRDEIVAVAGAQNIKPLRNGSVQKQDQIVFWEGEFPNHKRVVSFTSGVNFAGTRIGEIYLALSAAKTLKIRNQFIIIAAISLLSLLLIMTVLVRRNVNVNLGPLKEFLRFRRHGSTELGAPMIICPMCGTKKNINADGFHQSHFYEQSIGKISNPASNPEYHAELKGIDLSEIAKRRDLDWMKRQIILRCADIIQKLTA